jgi:hypothetical protein
MRCYEPLTPQSPEPRTPICFHLSSTRSGGPTQLRHLLRSCDRGSRGRDFTDHNFLALQNPEPRFSDATCQHPVVRPNALTPVLYSAIGMSRFGNSRLLMHKVTDFAKLRIPTLRDPAPRVPLSDQRLRSIREIAGRDFKEFELFPTRNAERRTPILRDLTPRVPVLIDGSG